MAAVCRSYASHSEALQAVDAALGAGIAGAGVRVLTGEPQRDARDEPVGVFAGGSRPQAPRQGHLAGDERRGGSFADADRERVISYPGGVEHMRVAGHRSLRKLLIRAGLDRAAAERDVDALHRGRVLVLVDAPEGEVERIATLLDG